MNARSIDKAIREAYRNASQVGRPQIDKYGDKRILLEGRSGSMKIRMRYNITKQVVETAYPPRH